MPLPSVEQFISTDVTEQGFKDAQKQFVEYVGNEVPSKTENNSALALKADKGSTLVEYGITDAYTKAQVDASITAVSGGHKAYKTLANAQADQASLPVNTIVEVTNDPTATNNGTYQWNGSILTKSNYDPLTQAKAYTDSIDVLTVNKNKKTPLKFASRNNISTEPVLDQTSSDFILKKLLKVEVINARAGKYYRIGTAYSPTDATYPCRWIVDECDITNFATSDTARRIISYTHAQQTYSNNSGIQTITLIPPAATDSDIRIKVTLDTNVITGTFRATLTSETAYAFIIDPAFYQLKVNATQAEVDSAIDLKVGTLNTLTLNSGKNNPLINKTRNAINSASHTNLNNVLLSAKVLNAEADSYYRIAIFVNGNTGLAGSNLEGWRIEKITKASYGTASEEVTFSITNTDTPSQIVDRSVNGIQKLTLNAVRGNEVFELIVDVDKLPAYGTIIRASLDTDAGYSYIIHPVYYSYAETVTSSEKEGITYQYLAANKQLTLEWQSGDLFFKQVFGVNGFNNLPNFKSLSKKQGVSGEWQIIQSYSSDVLPPLIVEAVTNPTLENATSIYTGGNHGTTGGADGYKTAINDSYQIILNGNIIDMGINQSGIIDSVRINISNRLHAFNTIQTDTSVGRYVIQQNFNLDFKNGSWCVTCFNKKLENITVRGDNGIQTFSTGVDETWLFLDGQYLNRVPFDPTADSGLYSAYPNAWAMLLQGYGAQWVTWYDVTYGLGDGSQISGNAKRFRGGGATNTKVYAGPIAAKYLDMSLINSYKWRMGISIQSTNRAKPVGADSTFSLNKNGIVSDAIIYDAQNYFVE